ncbi:DUF2938 domain-containing protein [Pseudoalteromonas sp. SMS1]|nr:DUF2938 domain-containing protein [Pseudoalteromonas sp. SMS1]
MSVISEFPLFPSYAVALGVGATMLMDVYSFLLKRIFKIQPLDYALVGRWALYLICQLQLRHDSIMQSPKRRGESTLGWVLHYAIGIIFASLFIELSLLLNLSPQCVIWSIAFGTVTVMFPFFVMQPCFGFGVAASKAPSPNLARMKSLAAHAVFGLGIYVTIKSLTYVGFYI